MDPSSVPLLLRGLTDSPNLLDTEPPLQPPELSLSADHVSNGGITTALRQIAHRNPGLRSAIVTMCQQLLTELGQPRQDNANQPYCWESEDQDMNHSNPLPPVNEQCLKCKHG
jgi:hypothetical protein